ncbi:MAG: type II toxin-antitoxin system VapC family toxin [Thermofilaceae archaeon]|nr:type II toxin-antitoxin system VapC family toxin [Thermofilaceae archaeon]MCX8179831.1 type II toxin-antitoxin system VapC family toxin [Thermofilaceae archaeon]MDW8004357.1 type II toxin-antitoxin system VapC family toxin [Thermofilaceae archaeon]
MRLLDADILCYALYDESIYHDRVWNYVKAKLLEGSTLAVTHTTILETFNVLYWFYRVRPRRLLFNKMKLMTENMAVVPPSDNGLAIALESNIPLGDGFLIATALEQKLPIIVSNDKHVAKAAPRYGLLVENPLQKGLET